MKSFDDIARANAEHYDRLLRESGDTHAAAQWADQPTQDLRLKILCEIGDLKPAKVLDFGCGMGRLYELLSAQGFKGEYVGYEIAPNLAAAAQKKHASARFECRDILKNGLPEDFDYVLISGVFNNKHSASSEYVQAVLKTLFARTRKGIAFNGLSTYVDYLAENLNYMDPIETFARCKAGLSSAVTLRHDYQLKANVIPYEFTIYVYKNGLPLPANQTASQ
ncbi:MAG: class I SAM-dependent methyltransferase [Rhizobiales bacterium]|jgi:SAM-dependent methyltransferase|nr:class I SAM-dependent methyltransferase [Hyphomicrobiales bacterium]